MEEDTEIKYEDVTDFPMVHVIDFKRLQVPEIIKHPSGIPPCGFVKEKIRKNF